MAQSCNVATPMSDHSAPDSAPAPEVRIARPTGLLWDPRRWPRPRHLKCHRYCYCSCKPGIAIVVRSGGHHSQMRWEYAHLAAGFDVVTQKWALTLRIPGRVVEKRTTTGVNWISEILNELGRDGWELIDRVATSTGGNAFVAGWQFILKRPVE